MRGYREGYGFRGALICAVLAAALVFVVFCEREALAQSVFQQEPSQRGEVPGLGGDEPSQRGEVPGLGGDEPSQRGEVPGLGGDEPSQRGEVPGGFGVPSQNPPEVGGVDQDPPEVGGVDQDPPHFSGPGPEAGGAGPFPGDDGFEGESSVAGELQYEESPGDGVLPDTGGVLPLLAVLVLLGGVCGLILLRRRRG
jgi:LPXTG-motif cell wall-anchored protein